MSRPFLILLPGTDGTGIFFADLVTALSPHADTRVIAYPQTGPQDYDHLATLIRPQLPVDRDYVLVGESFGGPLAIRLAAEAPRPPVRLILAATFAASPFGWLGRMVLPLMVLGEVLPLFTWQIDLMLFNGRNRAWAERIHEAVRPISRRTLMDRVRAVLTCDVRPLLPRLDMPVLCLNAGRDRLIPPFLPRHFGALTQARVVSELLPHMIFQSDAKGLTEAHILPFVMDPHALSNA